VKIPIAGAHTPEAGWTITGESGDRPFTHLCAAVGFGDPDASTSEYQGHAFALMGLQSDGRMNLIGEAMGSPRTLIPDVIDWKDAVGFDTLYVPLVPYKHYLEYAGADGLTYYRSLGKGRDGAPMFSKKPGAYRFFRSYSHVCIVGPVPEEIEAEFPAFLDAYQSWVLSGRALTADWCVRAITLSREGRRAIEHPLARAVVTCASILEIETRPKHDPAKKADQPTNAWYANRM
jgi:hypothetical protein